MNHVIKIYSFIKSNRAIYVFDLIFKQLLGIDYKIVSDKEDAHIEYSFKNLNTNAIKIPVRSNLLSSTGFEPIDIFFKNSGRETILFPVINPEQNQWDFDLLSAIFYLVSRYEEYKGFRPDDHKRFPPEASILHKTQSFEFPLVNIWIQQLKQQLKIKWPELKFNEPAFKFISTIDIDSTFQYLGKGLLWSLSGILKDVYKFNFKEVKERIQTLSGINKDAFDVFETIEKLHSDNKTEVIYFFLLADYAAFDKNINWKYKRQAELISSLATQNSIGIHPSYKSNTNNRLLDKEINRMKSITGNNPEISRQHFLILKFPVTYQNLIKKGIKKDYSLGYTSQYGFRAGIASPFNFYDLEKDEVTGLVLYPFCSMDITPLHYYNLTPEEAIEKNRELLKKVKEVNGTFISLWHNESLSGKLRWKGGWPYVYNEMVKDAAKLTRG